MSDLKVCRICLWKGVKVYNYDSFNLKQYYEEIMAKKINEKDGLPNYFCYECAAILYKFHKFKKKCWTGENVLQELLWNGSMTLSSISQIDRQDKNLQSSIGIITVSKRVRTHIIKHKTLSNGLMIEVEIPEQEISDVEECKINYESDSSLDDKDLAKIKNEMINEEDGFIEDVKPNIDIEESTEDKAMLDLEDDRRFVWPDNTNDVDKPTIKDEVDYEITIEEHNLNPELEISEYEIEFNKNLIGQKRKKAKTNKDLVNKKSRKFEVVSTKSNTNDVTDNTNDVDKQTIKGEVINEITVEEKTNLNTKPDISEDEIVFNKNLKGKKRKKAKSNKDLNKKSKRFEIVNKRSDYLDTKHWLKINLIEEEALEEFKAKAQSRKYVSAAFQCSDCFKGFSKEDMLNRHVKSSHSESLGPLECRFCKMRFKLKNKLTQHIEQHYSKYQCLRCNLICALKSTALYHDEYHNGVIRKCIHCGAEFRHLSSYYTHLRTHRSEHVCTLCGASFVSTVGLIQHKRLMHINTVVNPEEEPNNYCEKCDVKFETRKAYDKHVFHSAKHIEGVEALAVLIENPAPSMPELRKKLLGGKLQQMTPCTICNRNFPSYAAYLKHHKAEHKDDPLPSKEEERQICEICGASLAANSVASHLNTHTREKLYTCSTCNMQFNCKSSMKRHQLTHTGEKPFECSMCEKRFTQKNSMKLHYRTSHLKEPYPKRNRRKKTDIQQEKEDYRIHEDDSEENTKTHTSEKPVACTLCNKRFKQLSSMKLHH